MLTVKNLTHPTMIAKIRAGLKCAALGKGEQMGGHSHRVYIANAQGRYIMRINWLPSLKTFVVYGGQDWGQTVITDVVKNALRLANKVTK